MALYVKYIYYMDLRAREKERERTVREPFRSMSCETRCETSNISEIIYQVPSVRKRHIRDSLFFFILQITITRLKIYLSFETCTESFRTPTCHLARVSAYKSIKSIDRATIHFLMRLIVENSINMNKNRENQIDNRINCKLQYFWYFRLNYRTKYLFLYFQIDLT